MNLRLLMLVGLLIASAAVMPNVLAKFQGQHYFIAGKNVDCTKCHSDVAQEYNKSMNEQGVHGTLVTGGDINTGCRECHVTAPENKGYKFHAAALVECLACHGENPWPGAPNVLTGNKPLKSKDSAHWPFVEGANTTLGLLAGANEACIACHTHGGNATLIELKNYSVTAKYSCTDPSDITTCSWSFSISVE